VVRAKILNEIMAESEPSVPAHDEQDELNNAGAGAVVPHEGLCPITYSMQRVENDH